MLDASHKWIHINESYFYVLTKTLGHVFRVNLQAKARKGLPKESGLWWKIINVVHINRSQVNGWKIMFHATVSIRNPKGYFDVRWSRV